MEAPKSIYLIPDDRCPSGLSICWYEAPYSTGAVEYTRTDAFIDKETEWLRKELCNYFDAPREDFERFIEDFKKAMKL